MASLNYYLTSLIFSFGTPEDLLSCQRVSPSWQEAANNAHIWHAILKRALPKLEELPYQDFVDYKRIYLYSCVRQFSFPWNAEVPFETFSAKVQRDESNEVSRNWGSCLRQLVCLPPIPREVDAHPQAVSIFKVYRVHRKNRELFKERDKGPSKKLDGELQRRCFVSHHEEVRITCHENFERYRQHLKSLENVKLTDKGCDTLRNLEQEFLEAFSEEVPIWGDCQTQLGLAYDAKQTGEVERGIVPHPLSPSKLMFRCRCQSCLQARSVLFSGRMVTVATLNVLTRVLAHLGLEFYTMRKERQKEIEALAQKLQISLSVHRVVSSSIFDRVPDDNPYGWVPT